MDFIAKNYAAVRLRKLVPDDIYNLSLYLQCLGNETKRRFDPHQFDVKSLEILFSNPEYTAYLAEDFSTTFIIAYSVIRQGVPSHDRSRLESYGLVINQTDCTFAPCVADDWQGRGVGMALFHFMLNDLKSTGIQRIFLWGGVQADNRVAILFYKKLGFQSLGQFEYNGLNDDMIKELGYQS